MQLSARARTVRRATSWVILTIVLGAIGSGIWEKALRPLLEISSTAFVRVAAFLFRGYLDYLHDQIGNAPSDVFGPLPFTFVFLVFLLLPWASSIQLLRTTKRAAAELEKVAADLEKPELGDVEKRSPEERRAALKNKATASLQRVRKLQRSTLTFSIPLVLMLTVAYITMGIKTYYTRSACTYVERSLDILSPHYPAQEMLTLRAQYRQVTTVAAFRALDTSLKEHAQRAHVKLPPFVPAD